GLRWGTALGPGAGSQTPTGALLVAATRCAANSTICARRHVTIEPLVRRIIRSSRLPSSLLISRSSTRAAIVSSRSIVDRDSLFDSSDRDPLREPANVAGQTTSRRRYGWMGR